MITPCILVQLVKSWKYDLDGTYQMRTVKCIKTKIKNQRLNDWNCLSKDKKVLKMLKMGLFKDY